MPESQTSTLMPVVPVLPEANEVYDAIMREIEPELTTALLSTLEQTYKNETPEQAETRSVRYRAALVEYEKRFNAYMLELEGQVRGFQKAASVYAEAQESGADQTKLDQLETALSF